MGVLRIFGGYKGEYKYVSDGNTYCSEREGCYFEAFACYPAQIGTNASAFQGVLRPGVAEAQRYSTRQPVDVYHTLSFVQQSFRSGAEALRTISARDIG